jgi:hypothetical protein
VRQAWAAAQEQADEADPAHHTASHNKIAAGALEHFPAEAEVDIVLRFPQ